MPNVEIFHSMKKTSKMMVMLLFVMLLMGSGACTIHTFDDPMVFEPADEDGPPPRYHSDSQQYGRSYTMKQKLFFFHDEYVIKDQDNVPIYFVMKKNFTFGNKFSFRDERGVELAYISERVLSLMPKYKILRDGREMATILKKLKLFKTSFTMRMPGEPDIKITGDFWNYNYLFTRNGKIVAEVTRRPLSWLDTYGISVAPRENDVLILAAAAVIDMVCHSPEKECHDKP